MTRRGCSKAQGASQPPRVQAPKRLDHDRRACITVRSIPRVPWYHSHSANKSMSHLWAPNLPPPLALAVSHERRPAAPGAQTRLRHTSASQLPISHCGNTISTHNNTHPTSHHCSTRSPGAGPRPHIELSACHIVLCPRQHYLSSILGASSWGWGLGGSLAAGCLAKSRT